ncbi:MAG: TRAP transporter small permease subunit [Deltaproteobacteria bacterium]|nr:TRAP transporter small permease subunit [Deltaproteobacteria bacterium]
MLGSAYTLQRHQHIRTDFLYENRSTRTKGIVDVTLYITCYFPGMGIFMGSTGTGVVSFHNFSNYSQYFSD